MKLLSKLKLHHIALLGMFFVYAGRVALDADTGVSRRQLVKSRIPNAVNSWHPAAGRWKVQHGQLLSVAVFSYSRYGEPWQVQIGLYPWDGYLHWTLPEYPVFVDGRTDLYGGDILEHPIAHSGERLAAGQALPLAGWQVIYQDDTTIISQKSTREVQQ